MHCLADRIPPGLFIIFILFLIVFISITGNAYTVLFWDDFKEGTLDNWEIVEFGEVEVVDEAFCFQTVCEP
jgi:hypothetical protein